MFENIPTERSEFAGKALDAYLELPINPEYDSPDTMAETDAFIAGWESSIDHLRNVVDEMDVPGPMKSIVKQILESNRAEYPIEN